MSRMNKNEHKKKIESFRQALFQKSAVATFTEEYLDDKLQIFPCENTILLNDRMPYNAVYSMSEYPMNTLASLLVVSNCGLGGLTVDIQIDNEDFDINHARDVLKRIASTAKSNISRLYAESTDGKNKHSSHTETAADSDTEKDNNVNVETSREHQQTTSSEETVSSSSQTTSDVEKPESVIQETKDTAQVVDEVATVNVSQQSEVSLQELVESESTEKEKDETLVDVEVPLPAEAVTGNIECKTSSGKGNTVKDVPVPSGAKNSGKEWVDLSVGVSHCQDNSFQKSRNETMHFNHHIWKCNEKRYQKELPSRFVGLCGPDALIAIDVESGPFGDVIYKLRMRTCMLGLQEFIVLKYTGDTETSVKEFMESDVYAAIKSRMLKEFKETVVTLCSQLGIKSYTCIKCTPYNCIIDTKQFKGNTHGYIIHEKQAFFYMGTQFIKKDRGFSFYSFTEQDQTIKCYSFSNSTLSRTSDNGISLDQHLTQDMFSFPSGTSYAPQKSLGETLFAAPLTMNELHEYKAVKQSNLCPSDYDEAQNVVFGGLFLPTIHSKSFMKCSKEKIRAFINAAKVSYGNTSFCFDTNAILYSASSDSIIKGVVQNLVRIRRSLDNAQLVTASLKETQLFFISHIQFSQLILFILSNNDSGDESQKTKAVIGLVNSVSSSGDENNSYNKISIEWSEQMDALTHCY